MYFEYVKSAVASIRSNKGRSFLTMLGIIIGIAAVLTVLIIGDGMKETVNGEIDSLGASSVSVSIDTLKTDRVITLEQLYTIEENIDNIIGVSYNMTYFGSISSGRKKYDVSIEGGSQAMASAGDTEMLHGHYFSKSDVREGKYVVVLSSLGAKQLFGYENVVGNTVDIDVDGSPKTCTVVGVKKDSSLDEAYAMLGDEPTLRVAIPYTALAEVVGLDLDNDITNFSIYVDSDYKDEVLLKARSVVENVVGLRGENVVKISSGFGFDGTANKILDIITAVVAIIAAISLLVGGIGVMNIMTVSVTERTREIGIRKSLGARTSSILTQFLAEAAILTFTGGLIGIGLGIGISYIICKVVDFSFIVNPLLVAVVVLISTSIGLFFGIYPAKRAANLDPIEALRME